MSTSKFSPLPELLRGQRPADQLSLGPARGGIQRYVWSGAYGAMLIEVSGDDVWVNGELVVPASAVQPPDVQG